MAVRDHQGITLAAFNGLWQRGDVDTVPIDHFSDCLNIDFIGDSSFKQRPGIVTTQGVFVPLNNIKRIYNYLTQFGSTLIVLAIDVSGNGNIYHVIDSNTTYGPILTIAGMTDFAFAAYAGRGYISPFSQSLPSLNAPAAMIAALAGGTGLGAGVYSYASTFVNANGETNPSLLTTITTLAQLTAPTITPIVADQGLAYNNALTAGATYKWLFTYQTNSLETTIGPASAGFVVIATHGIAINSGGVVFPTFPDPATIVNVYRTLANGAIYYQETQIMGASGIVSGAIVGLISDAAIVANPTAPIANSTTQKQVQLNSIPIDPSGSATSRNIYRTKVGASALLLDHTLADNITTSYLDANADAALTTAAPTSNTASTGTNLISKGMSGQFVYVYAGDGTAARQAAGAGLSGTMTVTAGAGTTDVGQRIFGIVSQTVSGYNSPPTVLTPFVTSGGGVSFSSIPTSGSSVVTERLLVSTIVIPAAQYALDANPLHYQYFFVPNAVINNNTDTFLNNISFYDADLLADATPLLNNYTAIPAGAVLNLYHNRLIVAATFTDISLALVSQIGEPEAISQISGLIIAPLDGNAITNAQEYRDILYLFKNSRTLAYADNGGDPSSWSLVVIDNALGTDVHGIATVLNSGSSSIDYSIICTYQGISIFNGKYTTPELSWKISDYWQQLDRTNFQLIQIINDPITKKIYCVLPNRQLLVGNYINGMDWKNIKWCPWSFNTSPTNPGISCVAIYNIDQIILGADQ